MISKLITDWVNGKSIEDLSKKYFRNKDINKSIEVCTQIIYRNVSNAATWGLAALQKMPNSGLDWTTLTELEKKKLSNLPAMIHFGVNTDEAVLLRKNNVPRSIATRLGELYRASQGDTIFSQSSNSIRVWLSSISDLNWDRVKPQNARLSGVEYKQIWRKLSGS